MLISFEGLDASGKTTQIKLLSEYFAKRGVKAHYFREPGGYPLGEAIRELLLNTSLSLNPTTELLLFFASRSELVDSMILPKLNANEIVVLDRFYDSTIAYQGFGRGLDLAWIEELIERVTKGLKPDITFYLEISYPEAMKRKNAAKASDDEGDLDRMEIEDAAFYSAVIKGYDFIAEREPSRIIRLDALKDKDTLHHEIVTTLEYAFTTRNAGQ